MPDFVAAFLVARSFICLFLFFLFLSAIFPPNYYWRCHAQAIKTWFILWTIVLRSSAAGKQPLSALGYVYGRGKYVNWEWGSETFLCGTYTSWYSFWNSSACFLLLSWQEQFTGNLLIVSTSILWCPYFYNLSLLWNWCAFCRLFFESHFCKWEAK